jgi:hypothetical protein
LFESSYEDSVALEKGPLRIILDDYLLIPGKGGSKEKLKEWPDVTYFTHVLNGIVISGKILEKMYFLRVSESFSDSEKYVRLFFASIALHDSDKLFQEGEYGANNLDEVLKKNKQEIIKILSYYLRSLGSPVDWWDDLAFLILRNESRTFDYANSIRTKMDRSQLETIGKFVKLGDQTGGIKSDLSRTIFNEMKKFLDPYLKDLGENINIIQFSDLPQTLILDKLYQNFQNFLNKSDRDVVAYLPDAIVYTGLELNEDEYENIRNSFANEMEPNNKEKIDMVLGNFAPSGNSIRLDFSRNVEPSKTIIQTYIEKFAGRLLIWQGEDWKKSNSDFDTKVRSLGVSLSRTQKNGKLSFHLNVQENSDEESDEDTQKKRLLGLITCAQRVLYTSMKSKEIDTSKEHEFAIRIFGEKIFDMADALQTKTIESISFACSLENRSLDELRNEYERICKEISENLKPNFDKRNMINYNEFFNRAIGKELLSQDPPDKADTCVYCGIFANIPLKEENAFGIKPTAGTGKKITVLKYDENKFNGKICGCCIKENELRSSKIGKLKEALCTHIYMGDYYVPVSPENIVESLKNAMDTGGTLSFANTRTNEGKDKIVFRVGRRLDTDLGYHMVAITSKPGNKTNNKNKVEEFRRLKSTLEFVAKTGMKVRLTPLISSKRIFYPMFEWDNAPSWAVNLEMDKVRIDRLEIVRRELELMLNISIIDRSDSSLSRVIIEMNRSRRGIFSILWRYLSKESNYIDLRKYPKTMEGVVWYMEEFKKELNKSWMDKVVDEACGISQNGPKSNNDNTWMIRESMKLYIKYFNHDDEDLKEKISGTIWNYASRESKYAGKETEQHCVGFAEAFVGLMRSEFKQKMPGNDRRKDLIYQFALMYNMEKWRRIQKKRKDGEKDE